MLQIFWFLFISLVLFDSCSHVCAAQPPKVRMRSEHLAVSISPNSDLDVLQAMPGATFEVPDSLIRRQDEETLKTSQQKSLSSSSESTVRLQSWHMAADYLPKSPVAEMLLSLTMFLNILSILTQVVGNFINPARVSEISLATQALRMVWNVTLVVFNMGLRLPWQLQIQMPCQVALIWVQQFQMIAYWRRRTSADGMEAEAAAQDSFAEVAGPESVDPKKQGSESVDAQDSADIHNARSSGGQGEDRSHHPSVSTAATWSSADTYRAMLLHTICMALLTVLGVAATKWMLVETQLTFETPGLDSEAMSAMQSPLQLRWRVGMFCGKLATFVMMIVFVPQIVFNFQHKTGGGLGLAYCSIQMVTSTLNLVASVHLGLPALVVEQNSVLCGAFVVLLSQLAWWGEAATTRRDPQYRSSIMARAG